METNFDNKTYYSFEYSSEAQASREGSSTGSSDIGTNSNVEGRGKYSTPSMVLGIISLGAFLMGFGIFIPPVMQILSIIFAAKSRKYNEPKKMNGKAIAGLVCSIVSLALTVLIWIVIIAIIVSLIPYFMLEGFDAIIEAEELGAFLFTR
jgi:flagellar biosynthesis protein FlhB